MKHDDELTEFETPIELGAATELTQGIWDPVMKENFITPQHRDF